VSQCVQGDGDVSIKVQVMEKTCTLQVQAMNTSPSPGDGYMFSSTWKVQVMDKIPHTYIFSGKHHIIHVLSDKHQQTSHNTCAQ